MAVLTSAVGVLKEDADGKQNGASCNPDGGVPEDNVVRKKDCAVMISIRRWPQECQLCGLVEENGGNPTVS